MTRLLIAHPPTPEEYRQDGPRAFFAYSDVGLSEATDGYFAAHRVKSVQTVLQGQGTGPHIHEADFQFIYVVKGRALLNYEGYGHAELKAGDVIFQPRGLRHDVVEVSEDYEHIEISQPAKYATRSVPAV
jgi:quercetin dioxygenase-like cupin family protein